MSKVNVEKLRGLAREHLGYEEFRPGQQEAIEAVLEGRDTLVVQPTGSGKSAVYQIAGLAIEGSTLIVSPLIALQKDQLDAIQDQSSADAAVVNSKQRLADIRERLDRLEHGKIEYIFLAPEQLRKRETLERLQDANVSLFVVDEGHCISEWGHNFRPDYLRLGQVIDALGHPRVLALTATASARVRQEIIDRLHMRDPKILVGGFDRPNIYLRVEHFATEDAKRDALIHRVQWADKPGIIYVATRRAAKEISERLKTEGIEALSYHGGMNGTEREQIQDQFMSGKAEVIVATNAFGMGIDKPDIRFVYHHAPPESLDSYYQEIGRAGRDGNRADAILFFRKQDIGAQSYKTGVGKVDTQEIEELVARLADEDAGTDTVAVADDLGISERKLTTVIHRLQDVGAAEIADTGEVQIAGGVDPAEAARMAAEEQELRRAAKRERLEQMREYAVTTACRRQMLLQYFGDPYSGPCSFCDNCQENSGRPMFHTAEGTRREVG